MDVQWCTILYSNKMMITSHPRTSGEIKGKRAGGLARDEERKENIEMSGDFRF